MKCKPKVEHRHKTVDYSDLENGDAFVYNGDLFVKVCGEEQIGYCLNDGERLTDCCDLQVIPVNAEIVWSYKDKKNTKTRKETK